MAASLDSGLFVGPVRAAERPRTPSRRTVARHRNHARLLSPPLTSPDSTSKSPLIHSTPDMSLRRLGITPSPSPFSSLREQLSSPPRRPNLASLRPDVPRPGGALAPAHSPSLSDAYPGVRAGHGGADADDADNTASAGPRFEIEDMVDHYEHDRDQSSASSTSDYGTGDGSSYAEDGSRHVLVERLHDLARHIAREGWIAGGACAIQNADLSKLHAQLNDMERLIHAAERRSSGRRTRPVRMKSPSPFSLPESARQRHSSTASPTPRAQTHLKEGLPSGPVPDLWPPRPDTTETSTLSSRRWSWLNSPRQPDTPASSVAEDRGEDKDLSPVKERREEVAAGAMQRGHKLHARSRVSQTDARRIAAQAEQLEVDLQAVFTSLQERQEESEHLHDMLLQRAEVAARRVLELEKEVTTLEDEVEENDSELKHLRLKLRALEAVCQGFVYSQADVELVQSIENWKSDWEDVRTKMYKRRRTHRKQKRHHDES